MTITDLTMEIRGKEVVGISANFVVLVIKEKLEYNNHNRQLKSNGFETTKTFVK